MAYARHTCMVYAWHMHGVYGRHRCWKPERPPCAWKRVLSTSIGLTQQPPSAPQVRPESRRSVAPGGASGAASPAPAAEACTFSTTASSRPMRTALKATSRVIPSERPRCRPRTPSARKFCRTQSSQPRYIRGSPRRPRSLSSCSRTFVSSSGWEKHTAMPPASAGMPICCRRLLFGAASDIPPHHALLDRRCS